MGKFIEKFVQETNMKFEDGEIGFGRPCVGIINPETGCYLAYQVYDYDSYKEVLRHDVAMGTSPENAYHKGPYLAVLHNGSEESKADALKQLDSWLEKIMAAGYDLKDYQEKNSLAALMGGKRSITQKCVAGGVSFGKFTEIF